MDFSFIVRLQLSFFVSCLFLTACGGRPVDDHSKDEHKVGVPVATTTTLNRLDGTDKEKVFIFDELVRKVHQFSSSDMKFVKSMVVRNPDMKHYLISSDSGNYVVDLSLKKISIFDISGAENRDPLSLQGELISTAFRSDLGLLVVYDKNSNVGVLQIDSEGQVQKRFVGAAIKGHGISAGDVLSTGNLVLALDDGTLCSMDLMKTLDTTSGGSSGDWVSKVSPFASGLVGINWVAPIPENSNLVLVHSNDALGGLQKLSVIDLSTQKVIASEDLSGWRMEKYSKTVSPHIILREDRWLADSGSLKIMYVEDGAIKSRVLTNRAHRIMISELDLKKDQWSIVDSSKTTINMFNDIDEVKENRSFVRYNFASGVAIKSMALPAGAQLQLGQAFAFALFPTKLGRAVRYDLTTEETKEARFFNLGSL
ncbi:MAG: hypothetical protein JNM39_14125 [Bdellovibrionaceae bacterium]|nr:hypothetical protein [Pseudobdellovibrionaceae bacterium]